MIHWLTNYFRSTILVVTAFALFTSAAALADVQEIRVSQSSDDAEEQLSGSFGNASDDLELGLLVNDPQLVGIRFNGLAVPAGALITNAYVQFKTDESTSNTAALLIQGHAVSNASGFNSGGDLYDRELTSAAVAWSPPPWQSVGEAGLAQRTANIAAVLQEIIALPGWADGNSVVLLISGTGSRIAESYNGDPGGAPLLHLEYEIPVVESPPTISSLTPATAQVAMVVTLTGSNFNAARQVTFNGIPARYWVANGSTLHATIPPGNTNGAISVENDYGTGYSATNFTLINSPPVLVGAGDISNCGSNAERVAQVLDDIPGTVFTVGDNQYNGAQYDDFMNCYDPTWGRHIARTRPAAGNHEYDSPAINGYFRYFGAAAGEPDKGYYAYDIEDWQIITLNSQCHEVGGCDRDSPQGIWLRKELAQNPRACTAVVLHHPRYSTGLHGDDLSTQDMWEILYDAGVELVLAGHDHSYQRYARQDPFDNIDPNGVREFVIGMGGSTLRSAKYDRPNIEVQNSSTYGALKLDLHPGSYDWEFMPVAGGSFSDSGSDTCLMPNQPPVVIAGPDQNFDWPASAQLNGEVLDDGFPLDPGSVISYWSQVSGPRLASFADEMALSTSVDFPESGRYVLRLTAEDGERTTVDDVVITVTDPASPKQLAEFAIDRGDDDAEQDLPGGTMNLSSTDIEMVYKSVYEAEPRHLVGLRFTDVTVPQGSLILHAWLQFKTDETGREPTNLVIKAEASDNAAPFTSAPYNLSARSTRNAAVRWRPPNWDNTGSAGVDERSTDIYAVIQEITDDPNWASGNALALLISGHGYRVAEAYNGDSSGAPKLIIEYAGPTDPPMSVSIDVLPGDPSNIVFPNKGGSLPVAVMSSAGFSASEIDTTSLRFAYGAAPPNGPVEQLDLDGQFGNDLQTRFPMLDAAIQCNDTAVTLTGVTTTGAPFAGTDSIDASQCEGGCHQYP